MWSEILLVMHITIMFYYNGYAQDCIPPLLMNWGYHTLTLSNPYDVFLYIFHRVLWLHSWAITLLMGREHFVYTPSQCEMMLQCNIVSHWLGAHTKWPLKEGPYLCVRIHFHSTPGGYLYGQVAMQVRGCHQLGDGWQILQNGPRHLEWNGILVQIATYQHLKCYPFLRYDTAQTLYDKQN